MRRCVQKHVLQGLHESRNPLRQESLPLSLRGMQVKVLRDLQIRERNEVSHRHPPQEEQLASCGH